MAREVLEQIAALYAIEEDGGTWKEKDGQWAVFFDDSDGVFPFNKVRKQFQNGHEGSILSFFEIISKVFKNF